MMIHAYQLIYDLQIPIIISVSIIEHFLRRLLRFIGVLKPPLFELHKTSISLLIRAF